MSWVKGWRGTTGVHAALHSMGHERTSGSPLPAQGREWGGGLKYAHDFFSRWYSLQNVQHDALSTECGLEQGTQLQRPGGSVGAAPMGQPVETAREAGGLCPLSSPAPGSPAVRRWGHPRGFWGARSVTGLWGHHLGSGFSGPGSPPGGLSHRDSAKLRLSLNPLRLWDRFGSVCSGEGEPRGGGPGVRGLLSLRDALLTTPPPLSAPLFQLHHLPSGPDLPSPPPSLPPTLFSSQLHSSGKASGCSGGRMQLWWLCTTLLKVFTSMAQVPVGCRGALHPSKMGSTWCPLWAGSTGFQRNPWEIGVLFKVQGMFKSNHNTKVVTGTSLWSCGKASALSLHGARVPSLGRELRFCVPRAKRQISK